MKLIGALTAAGALGVGLYFTLRGSRGGGLSGPTEARELHLFCENDGDLYRRQMQPIQKNLATKLARGIYDRAKAEKLWGYLAESCAKKYMKETGGSMPWHKMFSIADRRDVAKTFNDHFLAEWKLGNYDHMLPKKYKRA